MDSSGGKEQFLTTRWSVVRSAGREDSRARESLGVLCEGYWYPLYAYLRRRGYGHAEAQDSVQDLFASLIERGDFAKPTPERGRFRSWLLTALKNHNAKAREREGAEKRGGRVRQFSIDWESGKSRFHQEPESPNTAEAEFERAWAHAILERARRRLMRNYTHRGKEDLARELLPFLGDDPQDRTAIAERLELREGALKVAIHRFRQRFGEALREEIGDTLEEEGDVDDELALLMAALAGES